MSVFHPNDPDTQREQRLIALMSRHKTQLMRMAYMYLGDAALAEDAVQETFLKAYAHLHHFRGESADAHLHQRLQGSAPHRVVSPQAAGDFP